MKHLIVEKTKVGYDGCYYLILPDAAAGRSNRYTVYRIPSSPSRCIKTVGLELDLKFARQLVKKLLAIT